MGENDTRSEVQDVRTERAKYQVRPTPGKNTMEPVCFIVESGTSRSQDYFTPGQAKDLAAALLTFAGRAEAPVIVDHPADLLAQDATDAQVKGAVAAHSAMADALQPARHVGTPLRSIVADLDERIAADQAHDRTRR
jgi:hypothetical protein